MQHHDDIAKVHYKHPEHKGIIWQGEYEWWCIFQFRCREGLAISSVIRIAPQFCGVVYRKHAKNWPRHSINNNYIIMHTFWEKKRKKNKLSSLPPSMECQIHLTLGMKRSKKKISLQSPSDKPNSGKKKEKRKPAASFHGRSVTPNSEWGEEWALHYEQLALWRKEMQFSGVSINSHNYSMSQCFGCMAISC